MPNNFDSNFTRKIARVFLDKFETTRVLSKNVNTQLLQGKFDPASGDSVDFKRPTDYRSVRTSNGDVSGETKSNIITGKATGTVQDYFTVFVDYDEADEAIKMDQLDELLAPMATRVVTDMEVDFAAFMLKNCGLLSGTVGTAATTWDHVAEWAALMESIGIPMDAPWYASVNPFTKKSLASNQRSLGAGGAAGDMISEAHRKAIITSNFAGFDKVMTATTLASYTTHSVADRVGALAATPDGTYVTHKDSMTQSLSVNGFGANLQIRAGETVTITGRNRLNLSTRNPIIDDAGNNVLFTGTVVSAVTLDGTGTGTITITGPGINETNGQYNTVDSALTSGDVVTLGGAASTLLQPNICWHKNAFSIGSVPIKKLHSTDTIATTEDGLQFRVSKGVGFLENNNKVRVDFRPAYGVMNPFFALQGYGS